MSNTRHIHISYFRIAWVFVLALQDFNYKCNREIIHKDGIMPASNYEMLKKWSDSWLVDTDHAWCCLLCCLILETSIRIPKQPLISPACFCKLSLSNVSRLSVCRPWAPCPPCPPSPPAQSPPPKAKVRRCSKPRGPSDSVPVGFWRHSQALPGLFSTY